MAREAYRRWSAMRGRWVSSALVVLSLLAMHWDGVPAQAAQGGAAPTAVAAPAAGIVKFTPGMSAGSLAGRPDTDLVELTDGRRIPLGDVRRLRARAEKLRASAPGSRLPKAFRDKPAATGVKVSKADELAAALQRPDGDTVVLPSGRRTTVGMIRMLQPQIEKKLGRSLTAKVKPGDLSGPAIPVGPKTDWKPIFEMPDGTVLESPNGKRITVGQLKQTLGSTPAVQRTAPAKR